MWRCTTEIFIFIRITIELASTDWHPASPTLQVHPRIPNHGIKKVVSWTFSQYSCSFCSLWGPYITQDIQIGGLRLEIVVKFEGISLIEHCVCGLVVLFWIYCGHFLKDSAVFTLWKSVIFYIYCHYWHFASTGCKIKYIFVTFSLNFGKGGKIKAWRKDPSQATSAPEVTSPSKACEPELRPSEPSSSAAEQPSPVAT